MRRVDLDLAVLTRMRQATVFSHGWAGTRASAQSSSLQTVYGAWQIGLPFYRTPLLDANCSLHSFMFMSLIFTTVGPAADYGSVGRYLLFVCTLSESNFKYHPRTLSKTHH